MIVIGYDHAGMELKEKLVKYFNKSKIDYFSVGPKVYDSEDSFVPYAKEAIDYYKSECNEQKDYLLLICGSGIGMSIVANRDAKIRAVLAYDKIQAKQARMHNNANCLCLGGRNTSFSKAKKIFETFISTNFLGGKYQDRINSI